MRRRRREPESEARRIVEAGPFHLECTRCFAKRPPFHELPVQACPKCKNPEFALRPGKCPKK